MNLLTAKRKYFERRMEVQNGSITGVNSDEIRMAVSFINQEMRSLTALRPPWFRDEWDMRLSTSIPLQSSGVNSVTGTKGLPYINDSGSNLSTKHEFWTITDGTYRHRLISATGTTYYLDTSTYTTATTNTLWTAYRDVMPLPHNVGEIMEVWAEDGDIEITRESAAWFKKTNRRIQSQKRPNVYGLDVFSNRFSEQKFSDTNVALTNGSSTVSVGTTVANYNYGDILQVSTSWTHTVISVDTTGQNLYLDRPFLGTTGSYSVRCNPKGITKYVTFFPYPDSLESVKIDAYVKMDNLVGDNDEMLFDEDLCEAVVVGALNRDKNSRQFLTEQDLIDYNRWIDILRDSRDAGIDTGTNKRRVFGGRRRFRYGDTS